MGLSASYASIGINSSEQSWLVAQLGTLNGNIADAVDYAVAHDTNITVIPVDISSVLVGHQFCDPDPWTYGPSIQYPSSGTATNNPAPFHLLPQAQADIAELIATNA